MADQKEKKPYLNPVKCLNFEGGHDYEHQLRVNISSSKVDPITGEMTGEVRKVYSLDVVCKHCLDRKILFTKEVGLAENISLAQMLSEHKQQLTEAYYAEHPEKRPVVR